MINLFIGHDPREGVGTHVFVESVLRHTTVPVSITPLHKPMLHKAFGGDIAEGTNAFTLSRFLIPYLCDWRGTAIFCDGADMLLRADLAELEALRDPYKAVQVVQMDYSANIPKKYVGTRMESDNLPYRRKGWASLMIINCAHYAWRKMTPSYLLSGNKLEALNFSWCPDAYIGPLPDVWNWMPDIQGKNDSAKLLHWTTGIPLFAEYSHMPHSEEWFNALKDVNYATE